MSKKAEEIGRAVYMRELERVDWPGEDGDALALADTIVNTGLDPVKNPEMFAPKYKALYIKRGASFWAEVRQAWRVAKYGA
jgi:hypothetical protein